MHGAQQQEGLMEYVDGNGEFLVCVSGSNFVAIADCKWFKLTKTSIAVVVLSLLIWTWMAKYPKTLT